MGIFDQIKAEAQRATEENEEQRFRDGYKLGREYIKTDIVQKGASDLHNTWHTWYYNDHPKNPSELRPAETGYITGLGIGYLECGYNTMFTAADQISYVSFGLCILKRIDRLQNPEVLPRIDRIVRTHQNDGGFLEQLLKTLEPYEAELSKEPWQRSFDFTVE